MPTTDESGLRRTATYWIAESETTDGTPVTPTDPDFRLWSRTVRSESGESSAEYEESLGLGDSVATDAHHNVESHERTITYELCRFPVDSGGNVQDPFAYGGLRDIDNQLETTLSHLKVVEQASIVPANTVHYRYFDELGNVHPATNPGASSLSSRTETYGRGGMPDEPELTANPGDSAVITVEMSMMFAEVRQYQIDQPNAEYIHVRSTNSGDTGATVALETVDGTQSATLTLDSTDATIAVATAATFDSLRVHVPDEVAGTIEVYGDDGSGTGAAGNPAQLLTYLRGTDTYNGVDSDTGVPLVGAGSFEAESALPEAISASASAGSWDGSPAAQQIMGSTITLSNNLEDLSPAGSYAADIKPGQLEPECESTVYGETESAEFFADHLTGREGELRIPTTRGDIVFPRAYVSEGGSTEQEAGAAVMQVEVVFRGLQPVDGSAPVEFVAA